MRAKSIYLQTKVRVIGEATVSSGLMSIVKSNVL